MKQDPSREERPVAEVDALKARFEAAPQDREVVHALRLALIAQGSHEAALEWFQKELALCPDDRDRALVFKELGEHFQNALRDLDNAQRAFTRARQFDEHVFSPRDPVLEEQDLPPAPEAATPAPAPAAAAKSNGRLLVSLTRAILFVTFLLDVGQFLAFRVARETPEWLSTPFFPSVGLTWGSGLEWAQRGLWASLILLVVGPLRPLRLLARPSATRPGWERSLQGFLQGLLISSGVLIGLAIVFRTFSDGPSQLGALLGALRAALMALTALLLGLRLEPDALELAAPTGQTEGPAMPEKRWGDSLLRQWWHWRSHRRAVDWVFLGFLGLSLGTLSWRLSRQRTTERAFHALDECLAKADLACANAAVEQLTVLGTTGPRHTLAVLSAQLLSQGWTDATAHSLHSLQAELGNQGLAGAEALLALGDAEAARSQGASARTFWATARGRGVDPFIEARLTRLQETETQRADEERDSREADRSRKDADEVSRFEEAQRRAARSKGLLTSALAEIITDFDAAFADAQEGRGEQLQIRLRILTQTANSVPAEARTRLSGAISALAAAGCAARRIEAAHEETRRLRESNYPTSYRHSRGAELERLVDAETTQRDDALALAQEQFEIGLAILRSLPVELMAPPSVRVIPLGQP